MRFLLITAITVVLTASSVVGNTWFSKAAYNKWHETELERWLSDHNIPYPTPADRKDLENLVKDNWKDKVATPYNEWDTNQLQSYLTFKGVEGKDSAQQSKDALLGQVKQYWYETEDQASDAYNSVRDWIFDSWSESQLKAFCDHHGIPVPQPRTRDSMLKTARANYQEVANKVGETVSYPGDWLYESWSTSDIKAWLDERGIPVPQPSTRDKLIATLRRNSRLASLNAQEYASSLSASASAATESLSDTVFEAWSDSQIKEWCDKNGIKVPQGSKRNELLALARKHRAKLTGDNVLSKASGYMGAATSSAGNEYAQATHETVNYVDWAKDKLGLLDEEAKASYSSALSAASKSASSLSSAASEASSSASVAASESAKKAGDEAAHAVKESASAAKHRAEEAGQKATDYVKEEL